MSKTRVTPELASLLARDIINSGVPAPKYRDRWSPAEAAAMEKWARTSSWWGRAVQSAEGSRYLRLAIDTVQYFHSEHPADTNGNPALWPRPTFIPLKQGADPFAGAPPEAARAYLAYAEVHPDYPKAAARSTATEGPRDIIDRLQADEAYCDGRHPEHGAREAVAIAEGIETALSVAIACPELRVLCAISLANMGSVALPPAVRTVILCADNDGDNAAAAHGLARAVAHFAGAGREVRMARSPIGKDFNDALRAELHR